MMIPTLRQCTTSLQAEIVNRIWEAISGGVWSNNFSFQDRGFASSGAQVSAGFIEYCRNIGRDNNLTYDGREQLKIIANRQGLRDAYCASVDRIRAPSGGRPRLVMTSLIWISESERQRRVDELCHAWAYKQGRRIITLIVLCIRSIQTLLVC